MRLAVLLIAASLAAACARQPAPATQVGMTPAAAVQTEPLRPCDDGGDGGVLIHGVCL